MLNVRAADPLDSTRLFLTTHFGLNSDTRIDLVALVWRRSCKRQCCQAECTPNTPQAAHDLSITSKILAPEGAPQPSKVPQLRSECQCCQRTASPAPRSRSAASSSRRRCARRRARGCSRAAPGSRHPGSGHQHLPHEQVCLYLAGGCQLTQHATVWCQWTRVQGISIETAPCPDPQHCPCVQCSEHDSNLLTLQLGKQLGDHNWPVELSC